MIDNFMEKYDSVLRKIEEQVKAKMKEAAEHLFEEIKSRVPDPNDVELKDMDIVIKGDLVNLELGTPHQAPNPLVRNTCQEEEKNLRKIMEG